MVLSFIEQIMRKDAYMTIYSIYKMNHPVTPKKEVVNVYDLGYYRSRNRFLRTNIIIALQKEEKK